MLRLDKKIVDSELKQTSRTTSKRLSVLLQRLTAPGRHISTWNVNIEGTRQQSPELTLDTEGGDVE